MKINHNISAMIANANLQKSDNNMKKSLERLSSGYKINSAKDDAAGMAISAKMHTQIRGLERASQNAADGVSLIQSAEGALNETASMLQRIRELSVQAANDTNTLEDRKAIQTEIEGLKSEITRVSTDTEFNQKTLLDGSCSRQCTSNNIYVSLVSSSKSVAATTYEFSVTQDAVQAAAMGGAIPLTFNGTINASQAGEIEINGQKLEIEAGDTLEQVYEKIRSVCDSINIDCVPLNVLGQETDIQVANSLGFIKREYGSSYSVGITCDNAQLSSVLGLDPLTVTPGKDAQIQLDTANGFGVSATVASDGQRVTITDREGFEMIYKIREGASTAASVKINMLNAGTIPIQVGTNEGQIIDLAINNTDCESLGIANINICTREGASKAIVLVDDAMAKISATRAQLGAYQNRLESAINSLDTSSYNLTDALTRIEDVDMSKEMSMYTQYNVLLQAGTSMLAQANSQPQQILQLLQ